MDQQKREINNIDNLLEEAYELFRMESVDQIVDYVLWRLSDKFIPSSVYIILNEGIMVNKIKTIAFQSMQSVEKSLAIETLKPFEDFFKKYTGTTSYLILKNELDEATLAPIDNCFPRSLYPFRGFRGFTE